MSVQKADLDFGFVEILRGRHKGKIGFFGAWTHGRADRRCVIWVTPDAMLSYVSVAPRFVRSTNVSSLYIERFKRENPRLALNMGVPL